MPHLRSMTALSFQRRTCRLVGVTVFLLLVVGLKDVDTVANEHRIEASLTEAGADIFAANSPVLQFKIEIAGTNVESLRKEPRRFVPATVREGELVYSNVAVHLKGAAGSFRSIDGKAALTLSFGKFSPRQRFHRLQKIHLNNSVQDPSFRIYLRRLVPRRRRPGAARHQRTGLVE